MLLCCGLNSFVASNKIEKYYHDQIYAYDCHELRKYKKNLELVYEFALLINFIFLLIQFWIFIFIVRHFLIRVFVPLLIHIVLTLIDFYPLNFLNLYYKGRAWWTRTSRTTRSHWYVDIFQFQFVYFISLTQIWCSHSKINESKILFLNMLTAFCLNSRCCGYSWPWWQTRFVHISFLFIPN